MKTPNRKELKQIPYNYSPDIDSKTFMSLYKKCFANPFSFLVIDSTYAS